MNKPDFLIIGGARCGSAWLYHNLKFHDEIWLPPLKELHYFDRSKKYPSLSHLNGGTFWKCFWGFNKENNKFRKSFFLLILKNLMRLEFSKLKWFLKYYSGPFNDNWYLSLFKNVDHKVCGEVTGYYFLDEVDVIKVHELLPKCKLIFIIRNPIDRSWSEIRKNYKNFITSSLVKEIIADCRFNDKNNYLRSLEIWKRYYPSGNLLLLYYDELVNEPLRLLKKVFSFLNVSIEESYYDDILMNKRINAAPSKDIPEDIELILAQNQYDNIKNIANELGGYTNNWVVEAERILIRNKD